MQKSVQTTDFVEMKKFLSLLNVYDVDHVELRTLPSLNKKYTTKIVSTDESEVGQIIDYIKKHGLENGTINCTFNILSKEALSVKKAINDGSIRFIRFLIVDFDPKREPSDSNASDAEKLASKEVVNKAKEYLKQKGFDHLITLDSGNGFHLFIPIENADVGRVKRLSQKLLEILASKFDSKAVEIDLKVFNPSRLGKLIGTPAVKGPHTEERPQRPSRILEVPEKLGELNSIEILENFIESNEIVDQGSERKQSIPTTQKSPTETNDFIRVDVEEWFKHYPELSYKKRPGDIDGVTLYIFDQCPLKNHSNNQNGASVSVTRDGKVRFRCLHESDGDKNIFDLVEAYEVPETAQLRRSSEETITIAGLDKGFVYKFGNFELSKNGLYMSELNKAIVKISNPLFVEDIHREKETNEIRMSLRYLANNQWLKKEVSGDILQVNNFKQLTKNGLVFKSRFESNVIDWLHVQKEKLSVKLEHRTIGWVVEEDTLIYQAADSYGNDSNEMSTLTPSSNYELNAKGDESAFDEFVKKEILGTELELAIAVGYATIAHAYFNVSGQKPMNNLIINVQGISSIGKTTNLVFIAALFGNPSTIIRNFNATNNAIIKLATDNHGGVPLIFDELGAANVKDLSSLFFQLSSGAERLRMDGNRQLVEQQKFDVLTLMSSEEHVEYYLQKDIAGLKVRHLEFSDITWTKSAEHAETIKKFIQNNYGHAVRLMIPKLFARGMDCLEKWFDESKAALIPRMSEDPLKGRIASNLSLIRTGALMAINLSGWELDLKRIDDHLIKTYENLIDKSGINKISVFDRVKELLVLNAPKFIDGSQPNSTRRSNGSIMGKVSITKDGHLKVNVISHAFEEMLRKEFQIRDVTYIIKKLLEEGQMKSEKGRNTKRVRINKKSLTTYEIFLPIDLKEYFMLNAISSQPSLLESHATNKPLEDDDLEF